MKKLFLLMCMVFVFTGAYAFEGEIKYRTFRNACDELLAMQPLIFNGENTLTIIVKGDKAMSIDDRKGTITILSDGIMTEYCPADNSGYSCPWVDPSTSAEMQFPGKATNLTREMLGETATMYVCEKHANIGMEINGWVIPNNFGLSDYVVHLLNNAIQAPGLLAKWTMTMGAPYPQSFASEITKIIPREVADSEFDIVPDDANMEIVKDWKKYKLHDSTKAVGLKFLKEEEMKNGLRMGDLVINFMEAHPVKPAKVDAVSYDLDEDWDF